MRYQKIPLAFSVLLLAPRKRLKRFVFKNKSNTVESQLKVHVHAHGFGLTTDNEWDLEVRIDLTVYIVVGTAQFELTIERDLQLRDLQLRL